MSSWPVQDAKARFSEMLDACIQEGAQIVSRRGVETAALVPIQEWRRLSEAQPPSIKTLLLADDVRGELILPLRGQSTRRTLHNPE